MEKKRIAVIAGDGIGVEITREALNVLKKIAPDGFVFEHHKAGGEALDAFGVPLPEETLNGCKQSDAVLLGSLGGRNGTRSLRICALKKGSWVCAADSACSATSVPQSCIPSLPGRVR